MKCSAAGVTTKTVCFITFAAQNAFVAYVNNFNYSRRYHLHSQSARLLFSTRRDGSHLETLLVCHAMCLMLGILSESVVFDNIIYAVAVSATGRNSVKCLQKYFLVCIFLVLLSSLPCCPNGVRPLTGASNARHLLPDPMVGDVNLFFNDHYDRGVAEAEIMIAGVTTRSARSGLNFDFYPILGALENSKVMAGSLCSPFCRGAV